MSWFTVILTLQSMMDVEAQPVPPLTGESLFALADGSLVDFDSVKQSSMVSTVEIVAVRGERDGRRTIVLDVTPEGGENSHRYAPTDLPYSEFVTSDGPNVDAQFVKIHFDRLVIGAMQMFHDVGMQQPEASTRTAPIVLGEFLSGTREYPVDVFFGGQVLSDKLGTHEWPMEVIAVKENRVGTMGLLDSKKR